jgi:hypothetical protein
MNFSSQFRRHRADLIAVLLTGLWLVFWRAALDTSWGLGTDIVANGAIKTSVLYNPIDTCCYLSFVQQYFHGDGLAGLLYTTEPHAALLWLFPLWLVGHAAAWTGLPVLGTYNVIGLLAAMVAVFLFRRAAGAFRLSRSACNWTTLALVAGSGGSWLWHLAHKLHLASPSDGGDLYFFDLFPSTTFLTYAYHSIGFAVLAGLWWSATETENRLVGGLKAHGWIAATTVFALLLGFSRPYEPIAFLAAWTLKTAWHGLHRKRRPEEWKAALIIALLIGAALAAGIGRTIWVSRQPVWSSFANDALALGLPRSTWVWTLAGWGVLAALGAPLAWKTDRRLAILPLAATGLLAFILIGLGSGYTKLASGLMIGPILLSGWGAMRLIAATGRLPKLLQVATASVTLGGLLGLPTFYMAINTIRLRSPAGLDAQMVTLARQLPHTLGRPPVIVLTDGETGTILPGLFGVRVWVGHWSLSPHYKTKIARLREAGLDPQNLSADTATTHAALRDVVADAPFDYALLDRRCHGAIDWLRETGWENVSTTPDWVLLRPRAKTGN